NPGDIPVLQLRNVDFSYGPVQVLFDVNLDVRRGETLALLGTNGAGKSTVLRVISGLGIPSRGVVRLNGHNVTLCSPETRVRWGSRCSASSSDSRTTGRRWSSWSSPSTSRSRSRSGQCSWKRAESSSKGLRRSCWSVTTWCGLCSSEPSRHEQFPRACGGDDHA